LRNDNPANVLAEGAQAFLLDIDHGMYPYTTSSSTTSGGVAIGLGVAPSFIKSVTGIAKAVQSHVGGGPFVTEIHDKNMLQKLHGDMTKIDAETGTTTGRLRRLGNLDTTSSASCSNGEC
jgi:adenylosuccinate synthase